VDFNTGVATRVGDNNALINATAQYQNTFF